MQHRRYESLASWSRERREARQRAEALAADGIALISRMEPPETSGDYGATIANRTPEDHFDTAA